MAEDATSGFENDPVAHTGKKAMGKSQKKAIVVACISSAVTVLLGLAVCHFSLNLILLFFLDLSAGVTGVAVAFAHIRWGAAKLDDRIEDAKIEAGQKADLVLQELRNIRPEKLGFFDARVAARDYRLLLDPETQEGLRKIVNERRSARLKSAGSPSGEPQANESDLYRIPPTELLQPEYAIGKKLITQEEYSSLRDEYFTQSELSLGLILPLVVLVFALSYKTLAHWQTGALALLALPLMFATGFLFLVGMERQQKYRLEVKLLILGRWDSLMEAAEKNSAPTTSGQPESKKEVKEITSSLKVEVNPLDINLRTGPAASPAPGPAGRPTQGKPPGPAPSKGTGSIGGQVFPDEGSEEAGKK